MRCAVLGDPIAHSLSPVLHQAGYDAVGLAWRYQAIRVGAGELAGLVGSLGPDWRGLSLTMPLKREALRLPGAIVTERAAVAEAANTVLLPEMTLDNTDIPGAIWALGRAGVTQVGSGAVILGAGATATSVGLALADLGADRIRLLARNRANAADTERVLTRRGLAVEVHDLVTPLSEPADLVVSTIPAAAQTPELIASLGEFAVLFEVIYHPWPTPLVQAWHGTGVRVVTGLDLLVGQAAVQFEMFTGLAAPVAAMIAAGQAALSAREGQQDG